MVTLGVGFSGLDIASALLRLRGERGTGRTAPGATLYTLSRRPEKHGEASQRLFPPFILRPGVIMPLKTALRAENSGSGDREG